MMGQALRGRPAVPMNGKHSQLTVKPRLHRIHVDGYKFYAMFYSRIQVDTCRRGDNLFCRQYRIQCRRRQGIQMDTTFIRAICIRCKRGIKPRLHLIHVARYKLYPALVSIGIACRRLHVSSATKLSLRRHVSTCIRIQVARPGYLYPAVNAALDAILTPTSPCARLGNA